MAGFFDNTGPINLALTIPYKGEQVSVGGSISADGVAALRFGAPGGIPAQAPNRLPVEGANTRGAAGIASLISNNPKTSLAILAVAGFLAWRAFK